MKLFFLWKNLPSKRDMRVWHKLVTKRKFLSHNLISLENLSKVDNILLNIFKNTFIHILTQNLNCPNHDLGISGYFTYWSADCLGSIGPPSCINQNYPRICSISDQKKFTDFSLITSYLKKCNSIAMATATIFLPQVPCQKI